MTAVDRRIFAAVLAFAAVAGTYAVSRVTHYGIPASLPNVPTWAGWLLVVPAFVAGQIHRGVGHGRGIIRSHLAAIVGSGVAVVSLAALALIALGGAS